MFPKIGGNTPKWMVYNGTPYKKMDDLGVLPLFLETPLSPKIEVFLGMFSSPRMRGAENPSNNNSP